MTRDENDDDEQSEFGFDEDEVNKPATTSEQQYGYVDVEAASDDE